MKEYVFNRTSVAYDIESISTTFLVGMVDVLTGQKMVYLNTKTPSDDVVGKLEAEGIKVINNFELNKVINNHLLISFNGKFYDDYMLAYGRRTSETPKSLNELSHEIINADSPYKIQRNGRNLRSIYGSFDIKTVYNKPNITLSEIASELKMDIVEYDLDWSLTRDLTEEELYNLAKYCLNDVQVVVKAFNEPAIQSTFNTRRRLIESELPGEDWAISSTNTQLGGRIVSDKGNNLLAKKSYFDFTLNGRDILSEMPKEWVEDILDYTSKVEKSMAYYKHIMSLKARESLTDRELIEIQKRTLVDIKDLMTYYQAEGDRTTPVWYERAKNAYEKYLGLDAEQVQEKMNNLSDYKIVEKPVINRSAFNWNFDIENALKEAGQNTDGVKVRFNKATQKYQDELVLVAESKFNRYDLRQIQREVFKGIPHSWRPIDMPDGSVFQPSNGGAHSGKTKFWDKFGEIIHWDIEGAYSQVIIDGKVLGEKGTKIYERFYDLKSIVKNLHKKVVSSDNPEVFLEEINDVTSQSFNTVDSTVAEYLLDFRQDTKLVANVMSGAADEPANTLYNPIGIGEARFKVQYLLYAGGLIAAKHQGEVLSYNTDGFPVYFKDEKNVEQAQSDIDKLKEVYGIGFGRDDYDRYIAKDDNSRILMKDGEVVEASGDVSHRHMNVLKPAFRPRIVDILVVEKLVNPDFPVDKALEAQVKQDRVDLFAWTLKESKSSKFVIDYEVSQRVNRIIPIITPEPEFKDGEWMIDGESTGITEEDVSPTLTREGEWTFGDHRTEIYAPGHQIGDYKIKTDQVGKFRGLPEGVRVSIENNQINKASKLPENINLDVYKKLIDDELNNWLKEA